MSNSNASIPVELAEALLFDGFSKTGRIVVGVMPSGVPQGLVASRDAVLGGIERENGVTLVVATPNNAAADETYVARLQALGFSADPFGMMGESKGFVTRRPTPLALGNRMASVTARSRDPVRALTIIAINKVREVARARPRFRESMYEDVPMPTLRHPEWCGGGGGGGGGGDIDMHTRARITTPGPIGPLIAHYHLQLEAQSWRESARATTDYECAVLYRLREATEREWSGLLKIVIAAEGKSAIVAFHVSMLRDAPGGERFFESAEWAELAP